MNPGIFFMPNMNTMSYMRPGINSFIGGNVIMPRSANMFGKIVHGIKSFNWRGLLNGANKTLNVMNQAIPLIKQAKPMVGNVKSMIQLARAFGKETRNETYNKKVNTSINSTVKIDKQESINNEMPTFFV